MLVNPKNNALLLSLPGSVFPPQGFIPHALNPLEDRFIAHAVVESFHKQGKRQWTRSGR